MKISNWLLVPLLMLLSSSFVYAGELIAGIAIASDNHVYVWHKDGMVTSGTSGHFERYTHARPYSLPPGKTASNIVAISIAGSDDHVYAWYDDGTVSSGTSTDLDQYRPLYKYTLPPGKTIKSIVGIGMAKDNRVYAWYDDITVSIGTTHDLDQYRAPEFYSLPIGKIAANIVEIDIGKSNNHVYAWYSDGTASSGSSSHLDSRLPSFGYVPAHVLYRWWGPGPMARRRWADSTPAGLAIEIDESTTAERYPRLLVESSLPTVPKPQPKPDEDPADTGSAESPAFANPFYSSFGSIDPMVAVGNQYLIVSDTGSMAFFDKLGKPLPAKNELPTSMGIGQFFADFVARTNDDGSLNETNINLYLGFPKLCDSPDYPQTRSGKRFCLSEFYDTRVTFDPTSKRFFIISQVRHQLWDGYYAAVLADVSDTSKCDQEVLGRTGLCNLLTNKYSDLMRRYTVFAVSRTEDPRDGFHQYMLTQSNPRDWPWMAVNGNHFVATHQGGLTGPGGIDSAPVATVFAVSALKTGERHPPYFRYYSKDVSGIGSVLPPTHHQNAAGLTYLLGVSNSKRLDIFAFPQANDPWTAPTLLKTFIDPLPEKPNVNGAVYRAGKIYLVASKIVEEKGKGYANPERHRIHGVRIPVEKLGASQIKASKDFTKGFLNWILEPKAYGESPNDRVSYRFPAVAVNNRGDMLFGYSRLPFVSANPSFPLKPEARYTLWYFGEPKTRRSRLLREGDSVNSKASPDYTTAVVDPSDDTTFWVALPYASSSTQFKTVIAKISP